MIVSAVTMAIVLWLVWSEASNYLSTRRVEHVGVDQEAQEYLDAFLNVSFPTLRCEKVQVVVQDYMGDAQRDTMSTIQRQPLGAAGAPIGAPFDEGSKPPPAKPGGVAKLRRDVGCRVWGKLKLRKCKGNVHIALGQTKITSDGRLIHHFRLRDALHYKPGHTIHTLRFGKPFPGMKNTLDGYTNDLVSEPGHYQYFINVIPTTYKPLRGAPVTSAQFSATKKKSKVQLMKAGSRHIIPGVFFVYDLSAYKVTISETRASLADFLTNLCAIVGGTVTVAGILKRLIGTVMRRRKKGPAAPDLSAPAARPRVGTTTAYSATVRGGASNVGPPPGGYASAVHPRMTLPPPAPPRGVKLAYKNR